MKSQLIYRKTLFIVAYSFSALSQAEIPEELLYQPPQNIEKNHLATIQGFQDSSSVLKFINARVYINYINDKATLNQSKDWKKTYRIVPGLTKIRFISDAQNLLSSGEISFNAQAGKHYQIKNNQADINSSKNSLHFWVEDIDSKELVTLKQFSSVVSNQPQPSYIPAIINR